MQRQYEYVKSFDGKVCSKTKDSTKHKLNVQDIPVSKTLDELYFGKYSYLIYFLPDYTLATDSLKTDLETWVYGSNFRSDVKNKFEFLDISNFLVEEVSDSYPLQLGDPITSVTNDTLTVKTEWKGQGFVYLTYIDKGPLVTEEEEVVPTSTTTGDTSTTPSASSTETTVVTDSAQTSTEISQWKQLLFNEKKNTVYRGFTQNDTECKFELAGLTNGTNYDVYFVESNENPDLY